MTYLEQILLLGAHCWFGETCAASNLVAEKKQRQTCSGSIEEAMLDSECQ